LAFGLLFLLFQVPLLAWMFQLSQLHLSSYFATLWLITLGCMVYCALCDPGQIRKDLNASQGQGLIRDHSFDSHNVSEPPMPKRAHKTWQYQRPVRRYDHYCRWLTNGIGLMNHREFFVMVTGLVLIGVLGGFADAVIAVNMWLLEKTFWIDWVLVVAHLLYSVLLLCLVGPIFRIHAGLVMRNELASEWKRNDHYVASRSTKGENVPVNDLSDDEFNTLFENFKYDAEKNSFDKGLVANCLAFWWTARWHPEQLGEF